MKQVKNKKIKFLVDQVSNRVIWMSFNPEHVPPIFDINLNYYNVKAEFNNELWSNFLNFELKYNSVKKVFEKLTLHNDVELKESKLARLKCFYITRIERRANSMLLKNNFYDSLRNNPDFWIEVFTKQYNCSKQSAIKLLNFRLDEFKILQSSIEFIRYISVDKIKLCSTLEEVENCYRNVATLSGKIVEFDQYDD